MARYLVVAHETVTNPQLLALCPSIRLQGRTWRRQHTREACGPDIPPYRLTSPSP